MARIFATRPNGWRTPMPTTSRPRWRASSWPVRSNITPGGAAATRSAGNAPHSWSPTACCGTRVLCCRPRPKPGTASAPSRPTTAFRNRPPMQRIRAMRLHPAMLMTVAALPAPDAVTATKTKALRPIPPATTVRKSRTNRDRAATARARNHPGKCPPATTLAAPARSWTRTSAATTPPASPANRRWTRPPRSRPGTRPCIRPRASHGRKATRRAPSRRRSGKRTGASSIGGHCCAAT